MVFEKNKSAAKPGAQEYNYRAILANKLVRQHRPFNLSTPMAPFRCSLRPYSFIRNNPASTLSGSGANSCHSGADFSGCWFLYPSLSKANSEKPHQSSGTGRSIYLIVGHNQAWRVIDQSYLLGYSDCCHSCHHFDSRL